MKPFKIVCLIWVATLLISCTDHIIYYTSHPFSGEGWNNNDTISLDLQITDSMPDDVEISFHIRNKFDYPYQDFSAMVQHNLPDTTCWRSYKIGVVLADSIGRWSGSGWNIYQSSISLGKAFIAEPGKYNFKIIHLMNDEHLPGINDIGIMVKKRMDKKP